MEQLLEDFNEQKESIEQLKNHALMRKNDIDKVHREIYGSDIKKEDGSVEHIEGTKERIENSLNGLDSKINSLSQNFNNELDSYKESYNNRISENKKEYIQLLKNTRSFIDATKDKINELLPGAMAAGLSHAYEAQKKEEVSNLKSSEEKFQNSIIGLIAISSIHVLISIYLLITTNKTIIDLIDYLPKMVTAFIPIYIPIFWIAYSSSKKVNLSKRLIEEYTHKEVLGKTFSGLSNQIEKIDNESGIQQELKLKLLFNFMQVSAENPGKLISDYNSADHPLMDAIEKSAKLTDAVEKLAKIPGFTPIAKKLADKAEKILDGHTKKVQDGIDINDDLQSREEEKSESSAL
ncbi:hypothetical protein [Comamonas terrigena]|uniref:hypothetical protein n=1 Tax=Comamonas terrigena TaxID=32013 RepID=UPI00289B8EA0|nr:hypothetical protein [Comamonas terrigena]